MEILNKYKENLKNNPVNERPKRTRKAAKLNFVNILFIQISNDLVNISFDNSGTHSLQSIFELINLPEEENIILNSIKDDCLKMAFVIF